MELGYALRHKSDGFATNILPCFFMEIAHVGIIVLLIVVSFSFCFELYKGITFPNIW